MLEHAQRIAQRAGSEIMKFHGESINVEYKDDDSPLTRADEASHEVIVDSLRSLDSPLPVLSEESESIPYAERSGWGRFWVVDPLDGTKEFIKESGEFTVNIALVEDGIPVLGVVYVPAQQIMYYAERSSGAFRKDGREEPVRIRTRAADPSNLVVVASRDHAGPEVDAFIERLPNATLKSMGSSLKFCLVAEGGADCYIRDVPTMEWDTAAAQCVVEAAGGSVTDWEGKRLTYNKEDLTNPYLMTIGDRDFSWMDHLSAVRS